MCSSSRSSNQSSLSLAQKKSLVKKSSKSRKKKPTIKRVARGLYLTTSPKGKKCWMLRFYHKNKQFRKVIGNAEVMSQADAIATANQIMKDMRLGHTSKPAVPVKRKFESAGRYLLKAYSRHWKPTTYQVSVRCFEDYLLPYFKDYQIDEITRSDVLEWFDSMRDRPGAANRALPLFSVLMQQAEDYGLRPEGDNPCKKIKRYRLKAKERFLTPEELKRLGEVLRAHETTPKKRLEIAAIRLLILTGARKSEILSLQWSFYRDGNLYLPDSKTGPKTIFLSEPARQILDSLPRKKKSKWVFPQANKYGHYYDLYLWYDEIRKDAGLDNVRLHDLRHSYASTAIRLGADLRCVGLLLGHEDTDTTLQYVHLCDEEVSASSQLVGDKLSAEGEEDD